MTITKWNSEIQEGIIREWMEGCRKAKGPQALRILRLRIAKSYGLSVYVVRGIIELGATQGLSRVKGEVNLTDGHSWEPINYHELVGNLKDDVKTLKLKFEYLLDGIQKVLDDGETMRIHIVNLRQASKWMKKRDALDMEEIKRASLDENKDPPLLEIEPQNKPGKRKERRDEIKTKPRATYDELDPMEKIDKLRTQADNAHKRGELLFREINEGKAGDPR